MMYGMVLIAVLAVMGGVIAYIGDKLGSKVGKKKLTVFGLRPKHTSILVTIITGILIAATTLGVMTVTSRDVRTALFGMKALKAELSNLSRDVQTKNGELESMRSELQLKTTEYNSVTAKIEETTNKLAAVSADLKNAIAQRDRTALALNKLQDNYSGVQRKLTGAQTEIDRLQKLKSDLESDVTRLNELTANLRKGIQIMREGVVVYRAGEVLTTSLIQGGKSVEETQKELAKALYSSNQVILNKLNVRDKKLEALWISKTDFSQAVALISSVPQEVVVRITATSNTVYGEPVIGQINLFPNRLVYNDETVVYIERVDIRNRHQAEETVLTFLQKVNQTAIKAGILPDPLQGTVGSIGGSQLFDIINKVKRSSGRIEIRAVTTQPIYTVGPLKIDIQVTSLN